MEYLIYINLIWAVTTCLISVISVIIVSIYFCNKKKLKEMEYEHNHEVYLWNTNKEKLIYDELKERKIKDLEGKLNMARERGEMAIKNTIMYYRLKDINDSLVDEDSINKEYEKIKMTEERLMKINNIIKSQK